MSGGWGASRVALGNRLLAQNHFHKHPTSTVIVME